jgi:thymidylate synthase
VNTIYAHNVPHAYSEAILKLHLWGEEEESRNGPVISCPDPVFLRITHPEQRVLFDETRDCNPFFHVMEFVWMMAGSNDVRWIEQFNKRFRAFADTNTDVIHGAYGHRWINHFPVNQISAAASLIRQDPTTRRAVISMWDPSVDLTPHNDLPCNTSIMFRVIDGQLDMTVVNRSNDLIWGMLGANAVHMTYLHELMAHMTNLTIGHYQVFTNNLHIYKNMPKFEAIWSTTTDYDLYRGATGVKTFPILQKNESYGMLVEDCKILMRDRDDEFLTTTWARHVAWPIQQCYMARKEKLNDGMELAKLILAQDWRLACEQYINRREKEKSK